MDMVLLLVARENLSIWVAPQFLKISHGPDNLMQSKVRAPTLNIRGIMLDESNMRSGQRYKQSVIYWVDVCG